MRSKLLALSTRAVGAAVLAMVTAGAALAKTPAHFEPFAFLAGACWSGAMPDGKAIDAHCWEWVYGGSHLRDRHTVRKPGEPPYHGETIYSWDPAKKRVVYRYWNSLGGFSDGDFEVVDGALVSSSEKYVDADGTQEFRTVLKRLDDARYEARTEKREKGEWRPAWRVEFSRVAADSTRPGSNSGSR